eukprot:gnl/Spiro4/8182_TR4313_c0_g1_i1.p1 gnl/Spiro4/8182_TR4313_c0_g1~~gnl/Spiro4/8182_TR4313_c0_g1_i1.p1  ORF type:complete len:311 (-),score=63.12 gnl/Spiro4/8182_TR4313_c0_g1_i1:40-972(-)
MINFGPCDDELKDSILALYQVHRRLCEQRFGETASPNPPRLFYTNLFAQGSRNHQVMNAKELDLMMTTSKRLMDLVYKENVDSRSVFTVGFLTAPPNNGQQLWHLDYEFKTDNIFVPLTALTLKNGTEYLSLPTTEHHIRAYPLIHSCIYGPYIHAHPQHLQESLHRESEATVLASPTFFDNVKAAEDPESPPLLLPPPFETHTCCLGSLISESNGDSFGPVRNTSNDDDANFADHGWWLPLELEGATVKRLVSPAFHVVQMPYYTVHHGVNNEEAYNRSMFYVCTKERESHLLLWAKQRRLIVVTPDDD